VKKLTISLLSILALEAPAQAQPADDSLVSHVGAVVPATWTVEELVSPPRTSVIVRNESEGISFTLDSESCLSKDASSQAKVNVDWSLKLKNPWRAGTSSVEKIGNDYNYTTCTQTRLGMLKTALSSSTGADGPSTEAAAFVRALLKHIDPPPPPPAPDGGDVSDSSPVSEATVGSSPDEGKYRDFLRTDFAATYLNYHRDSQRRGAGGIVGRILGSTGHYGGIDAGVNFAFDGRDVGWDSRLIGFTYDLHLGGWLGVHGERGILALIGGGGTNNFSSPRPDAGAFSVAPAAYLYSSAVVELDVSRCFRVDVEGTLQLRSSGEHGRRLRAGTGFGCWSIDEKDDERAQISLGGFVQDYPSASIAGFGILAGASIILN
jgi:hypothetical protein